VELNKSERTVRILFADDGPGVRPELKQRIFDDFFAEWPEGRTGSGLGLGFVRRVVQAHGGTIMERGCSGVGAEFVIELPQRVEEEV
jgi:signal transduction histidine kinase